MNLPCEIVMDLVALYQDGLASPMTKNNVAAHLRTCAECRRYYKQYRRFSRRPSYGEQMASDNIAEQEFCRLAEKMRHRRMLIGIGFISYFCASGCLLVLLWMRMRKRG
ncbi:zf-HC2 domain-containing protein [Anaerotignum sp.]|uniref:zf-HC2 domain-containing protein n=1 Tax=Anaerotignum sp. TaxID=2039241 RepID=UPI002A91EE49|nr:zf-HC2 domain-containing protein [Anaerotignum sp.]MCI7657033.1 zf-HC2 domain-containing protein [Clostridia bacterium]MDY5414869.1 zf-HC2 domain-containing protein [Anaerotignum sp.]